MEENGCPELFLCVFVCYGVWVSSMCFKCIVCVCVSVGVYSFHTILNAKFLSAKIFKDESKLQHKKETDFCRSKEHLNSFAAIFSAFSLFSI